ncbi:MAG TPA: ATP-binding protein [Xanthobacteraceae bacterium]
MLLAKTLRSSTLKVALIFIGIFGAAVVALFAYVYWSTSTYVLARADGMIAAEHAKLRKVYDTAGQADLVATITRRLAEADFDGGVYLLADQSFRPLAGNLTAWPAALTVAAGWADFTAAGSKADTSVQTRLRAVTETLPDGSHLLVGRDISDLAAFASKINTALLLGIALIFVLAASASVMVTRRTVGRIEAVNATSRAIMRSGGLGERIPLRGTRDEWDQLAANLNLMLDRIEALMGEVKQVTDSVAHDLRTPLARIRGRLERASTRPRAPGEDQVLINDALADLDVVLRMFASLTRISQIETSDRTAAFRTVNLAEIAHDVVELFDAAAEDAGVRLTAGGDARVLITGDRDLLFDAVSNLVDNAIKHGRRDGHVTVSVACRQDGATMAVADDGPGIPAHEFPHVFKRFYRLERSRRAPGNGLGLSLVAAVARLHGARIEMHDNAPGLQIRLHFPGITAASVDAHEDAASAAREEGSLS